MARPTIEETLSILEGKRKMLLDAIAAADTGTNEPHGYQAIGQTQAESEARGLAWIQGRTGRKFLLPELSFWFQRLRFLQVTNLPAWTGEPEDETKALELLDGLIAACRGQQHHPHPPRLLPNKQPQPQEQLL